MAPRTCAPWGAHVISLTKSRKIPTRKMLRLCFSDRRVRERDVEALDEAPTGGFVNVLGSVGGADDEQLLGFALRCGACGAIRRPERNSICQRGAVYVRLWAVGVPPCTGRAARARGYPTRQAGKILLDPFRKFSAE